MGVSGSLRNGGFTVPNDHDGMRELVLTTLTSACRDKTASPSAKVAAARTLAEVLGMLKSAPARTGAASPVGELSEAELDQLIASRASPDTVSSKA